ncbi:anthranilate phosphoribosyltransferase [Aliidiomarina haloalkalitolerans]|uniref:Anthranilate phosphoribosyltransferase n=2 Tax=Gammaproteobacteria TaxID=1236 RepID=A0A432VXU2_9GAMM|nr:anthranilate phosphoribosyltransferase [Aliidiomarina haloalkalitolerans]RUO21395.1 anthranilate phosphoribosyltransferase [Aliidiomarina haloalkalitolerans]
MRELHKLLNRECLSVTETEKLFQYLIRGQLTQNQIAAILVALKVRGETPAEIAGAAKALLAGSKAFPALDYPVADTCGTGGDGSNTINISTAAALVCASMGMKIAKHGNRSVSSRSGSADVLESMGIPLDLSPDENKDLLDRFGFCFLFAPHYHPGVRYAMPVRQELKTRTLFNLLGPLINPARPSAQLLGVYTPELCRPLAETLQMLGCERAMVVHGNGLDEFALHGATQVVEVNGSDLLEYSLTPEDFGLQRASIDRLKGGDAEHNARLLQAVFRGEGVAEQRDAIAMNTAAVRYLTGAAATLKEACAESLDHIRSGNVARHVQALQEAFVK